MPKAVNRAVVMNTSCRRAAATICPRPSLPSVGVEMPHAAEPTASADINVAVGSHGQYVPTPTAASPDAPTWSERPGDLWPFDLESGVWVTCDVGYLCANFSLPRHRGSPRHTWVGHQFEGQKVKGQFAGGGCILWRPPAQLVIFITFAC